MMIPSCGAPRTTVHNGTDYGSPGSENSGCRLNDCLLLAPYYEIIQVGETFSDPNICLRCTPSTECGTECDPASCILCPGMTVDELPLYCTGNECPNGLETYGTTCPCAAGFFCSNGCCLPI